MIGVSCIPLENGCEPSERRPDLSDTWTCDVTYEEFNAFCASLPAATHVVQWGGSHVWKVGGKVFAIGGWNKDGAGITFKVSELSYEILKDQPGL
ncbi:MAG: MmcQ/YjbR family DNA-binding protein, partial [Kiloniellales bacterium]|nr:MmcQ/YjbR family DNA-binding protein [Kiloniellales bacterium]